MTKKAVRTADPGARAPLGTILVATDFSKGAELALGRALLLPLAHGASLHVVHVIPPAVSVRARTEATASAKRDLAAFVERARAAAQARKLTLTTEVLSGAAFVEIIRCSRRIGADLIVLGRHGRRGVRDKFIGTTTERVIRKGDVPVLAVNMKPVHPYRRPLIATDLEDSAPGVVDLALRVVGQETERVSAVHAVHVPFEGFVTPVLARTEDSSYRRSFKDEAKVSLAKLLSRYMDVGVRWKAAVRAGDARSVVLAEAVRAHADLVAVGTHGRSGVAHALLGSVAEWVIAQAVSDVLVGRPVRFSFELP